MMMKIVPNYFQVRLPGFEAKVVRLLLEGNQMADWTGTKLKIIRGADHTFGTRQPWNQRDLTYHMQEAVKTAIEFFKT